MHRVGPFELTSIIARGGMGAVWAGASIHGGRPVALKVLTANAARRSDARAAFLEEVRAMARLDHPHVVHVYEHGFVSPEEDAGEDLRAGSPYLAMELVPGGSIRKRAGRLDWPSLRHVLSAVLEALAHAHARGLVHRDVKPGNVLADASLQIIKLSDFGLAQRLEDPTDDGRGRWGTPPYMAPEQIVGAQHDLGPWTDLYALGCLAHTLATGRPPYEGTSTEIFAGHLGGELPAWHGPRDAPAALEGWVHRLLRREPHQRFVHALDARRALEVLERTAVPRRAEGATAPVVIAPTGAEATAPLGAAVQVPQPISAPVIPRIDRPLVPARWPRRRARHDLTTEGLGLGLSTLRLARLAGRGREREVLWAQLLRTSETLRPTIVLIEGPRGVGKTRLSTWLSEQAYEHAGAVTLSARFGGVGEHGQGLDHMIRVSLGCAAVSAEECEARIATYLTRAGALDPTEHAALLELASPRFEPGGLGVRHMLTPEERHAIMRRHLRRLARDRVLVLRLEDVEASLDALQFLGALDALAGELPVLALATLDPSAMGYGAERRLAVLRALPHVQVIRVGPLQAAAMHELLRDTLDLDAGAAARVVEAAAGNPAHALELVGEWVSRGEVAPSDRGFELRPDAPSDSVLPPALPTLWARRAKEVAEGSTVGEGFAIGAAALLGHHVAIPEWREVLARLPPCDGLDPLWVLDRLFRRGLARSTDEPTSFVFAHPGFRQGTMVEVERQRATELIHGVCAQVLAERGAPAERVARHLLGAGRTEEAVSTQFAAAEAFATRGDASGAESLLAEQARALDAIGAPADDPRRVRAWILRSQLADARVQLDEMDRASRQAEQLGRGLDDPELLAAALVERARYARRMGDPESGAARLEEALALVGERPAGVLEASVLRERAWVHVDLGELDRADALLERAAGLLGGGRTERLLLGLVFEARAAVARSRGEAVHGVALATEALALATEVGYLRAIGTANHWLGELSRQLGRFEEAERHYRRALEIGQLKGDLTLEGVELLNLAHVARARERFDEGHALTERGVQVIERTGRPAILGAAQIEHARSCALIGDWASLERMLRSGILHLEPTGLVDVDIAEGAEACGTLALASGRRPLGQLALQLAERQWRALGHDEAAERARASCEGTPR